MKTISLHYLRTVIKNTVNSTDIQPDTKHSYQIRRTKCLLCIHITQAKYNLKATTLFEYYKGELIVLAKALHGLVRAPTSKHLIKSNSLRLLREIQEQDSLSL